MAGVSTKIQHDIYQRITFWASLFYFFEKRTSQAFNVFCSVKSSGTQEGVIL